MQHFFKKNQNATKKKKENETFDSLKDKK